LRRKAHGGFGERSGETDREQSRHRAPGLLSARLRRAGPFDPGQAPGKGAGITEREKLEDRVPAMAAEAARGSRRWGRQLGPLP
jgi:hypothetical protein